MGFTVSLAGRVALVTGASAGLGAHFAIVLAKTGARVAIAARRVDACETVRAAIVAAGGEAIAVSLDVTDPASVAAAVEDVAARLGGLDILVNNAGVAATTPLLDLDEATWDGILDTNLKGAFLVGQAAAQRMRASGTGGAIVNIASILGERVAAQVAPYAASKAGLIQLTRAMALEWARYGIRVNALCPGYIETDLNRAFFATEAGQALIRRIPQRRLGQPGDLDLPLLLLCAAEGGFMTGAAIAVDGGHLVSSL
jgi:NAD(P)-dependent dehydrogenase (short-subunit alcohol dehydrogenase family)